MNLYKGIFWYVPSDNKLITIKVKCNENGITNETVDFSSKSGENFNHEVEWVKLPKRITSTKTYNYYPRGRVEIKNGKAKIFLNPDLNKFEILNLIYSEFSLSDGIEIKEIYDNSKHYGYLMEHRKGGKK